MFTPGQREALRHRLFAVARSDPDVVGGAHTGSFALDRADGWSDIDMALGVRGDPAPVVDRWTRLMYESFDAIHHWDLPVGRTLFRVFLLPGWLEVDIAFAPEGEFGPRGPKWQLVFGTAGEPPAPPTGPDDTVGLCWHHILHAAASIARGKPWRAEWFVAQARHHVIELACRRLGLPAAHGRGTDQLPAEIRTALAATLVADLAETTLRRALAAVAAAYLSELDAVDPALAARLRPMYAELAATSQDH